jgi:hypothetical protein
VASEALSIETARLGTADQNRIRAAMTHIGWQRAATRGFRGIRWWEPKS